MSDETKATNESQNEAWVPGIKCQQHSRWRRCRRYVALCLLAPPLVYGLTIVVGLFPTNLDFQPPNEGIEVRIISSAVHADLILPLDSDVIDWRDHFPHDWFPSDTSSRTHMAIGWGEKSFFLETPTWADLTFRNATKALLWPSDSCLHITMTRSEWWQGRGKTVRISTSQYREMVDYILAHVALNGDGQAIVVDGFHYGNADIFVEARGRYHALNTCNSWIGRAMSQGGIRTPWLTPLPKTMFLWLPAEPTENGSP